MKKLVFIMPLMSISLLASCGNNEEPKDEEYEVTFSVPEREDTILYSDKTQIVKWGEAPTKPKKDPYRVGYKFTGWYKDEKCSKIFDFQKDRIKGITTLYSGWEEDPKFAIPLCFTSNADGNTLVKNEQFYYKNNLSDNWEIGKGETITLGEGKKIYIGSNNEYEDAYDLPLPSKSFNVSGNIMSLIDRNNFKFLYEVGEYQFANMFRGYDSEPSNVVDAGDLLLPATKLGDYCYSGMFILSKMLIKAPQLPTITLAIGCYSNMFYYCTSLTSAIELPATILVLDSYYEMFEGCEKLNYVKVGFGGGTDGWPKAEGCTQDWLNKVSATGTFVWRGSPTGPSTRGVDTVPDGWDIQTY